MGDTELREQECVGVELGTCKWKGHLLNGRGSNGCAQNFLHQENGVRIPEAECRWREALSQRGRADWQTAAHCHSFLSPLTCAVRSVYRAAEHQGLLHGVTSYLHGAVSSGRGAGTEVHE